MTDNGFTYWRSLTITTFPAAGCCRSKLGNLVLIGLWLTELSNLHSAMEGRGRAEGSSFCFSYFLIGETDLKSSVCTFSISFAAFIKIGLITPHFCVWFRGHLYLAVFLLPCAYCTMWIGWFSLCQAGEASFMPWSYWLKILQ